MHLPVLQKEVIEYLDPKTNENFVDATIGLGGHTIAILERTAPEGKVLGIELDPELYRKLAGTKINRLILKNDSYINLKKIVEEHNFKPVQGILFDLGISSWHLEKSGRGFSFQRDEPLDMRYSEQCYLTAGKIVNEWSEKEIEKILREYGQERFSRGIAKKIVTRRKAEPIKTTLQLVKIIKEAVPKKYHRGKPRRSAYGTLRGRHPATRTFQALRIAVNDELENIKKALPQALEVLASDGRIVIISFHSLEDRIVKNFFKENTKKGQLEVLTKKPISPGLEELKKNPRSKSAKLRAATRL